MQSVWSLRMSDFSSLLTNISVLSGVFNALSKPESAHARAQQIALRHPEILALHPYVELVGMIPRLLSEKAICRSDRSSRLRRNGVRTADE